jgi:hypothetical protein
VLVICEAITFIFNVFKFTKELDRMSKRMRGIFDYIDIVSTGVTLIIDLIVSVIFIRILKFYITSRQVKVTTGRSGSKSLSR